MYSNSRNGAPPSFFHKCATFTEIYPNCVIMAKKGVAPLRELLYMEVGKLADQEVEIVKEVKKWRFELCLTANPKNTQFNIKMFNDRVFHI